MESVLPDNVATSTPRRRLLPGHFTMVVGGASRNLALVHAEIDDGAGIS